MNTRALDLYEWMLTEDQIIIYSIKEPSESVFNDETNHISIWGQSVLAK